jgi:glycosyltransferase involved in cell wall biosynthesis
VEELRATFPDGPERERLIQSENRKRQRLAHLVDAGIGVSVVLKRYISDVLKIKKSYSIPNGSDPSLFYSGQTVETVLNRFQDTFKVFWMGNAGTSWQGMELMLDVARKLEKRDRSILFILVTGECLVPLPVLSNVLVLRQLSYHDLPHYLAAADVCLCLYKPYDWLSYGFYGSALKLFDYMAAGKPVIASRMGQIAEVIRDGTNGLLVDNDSEMIIEKIRDLIINPEKMAVLGRNARADVVSYYNWDRVAEQTERVLMDVCAR